MAALTFRLDLQSTGPVVNKNIYGHFAEHLGRGIYEGLWVGETSEIPNTRGIRNDVLDALRQLNIPVLRWPGGCFADEYHWKDGVGPREARPSILNTHWGRVVENNHFGTHEFFDLCELLETDAYVCGNVGSGTVQEMMEWVEYMTSDSESPMANWRRQNGREKPWKLPFFGVGNESWGCGGNMRPEYYADEYRRYNCFVKNYSGNELYRIACGANVDDYRWTDVMMERAKGHMNGLSLHYYALTYGWPPRGSATEFPLSEYGLLLKAALHMKEILNGHIEIMDRHDPEKKVGLLVDEWGTWLDSEPGSTPGFLYQQNGIRDALVAAATLHLFQERADRVQMANIAQMVNVLQSMVLTDGPRMLRTPTFWAFEMLKGHQNAQRLDIQGEIPTVEVEGTVLPKVSVSATKSEAGEVLITFANLDPNASVEVEISVSGTVESVRTLAPDSVHAHNTFEQPDLVSPKALSYRQERESVSLTLPKHSVTAVTVRS